MKVSLRTLTLATVLVTAIVGSTLGSRYALGQQTDLREQIVGGWALDSIILDQNGKRTEPYGANPRGFLSLQPDGRFSWMIIRSDLPRIASNNRFTATEEEGRAVFLGTMSYYGKYEVDEKSRTMTLKIEFSSYTNWNGTTETRLVRLSGDEMQLTNPTPFLGGTSYINLRRAR